MARAKDLLQVMMDTRLSAEARILVMHVAAQGDGWVAVDMAAVRRLLNQAGEKVVRRSAADAVQTGWLERRDNVGRGHPQFRFCPADSDRQTDTLPGQSGQAEAQTPKDDRTVCLAAEDRQKPESQSLPSRGGQAEGPRTRIQAVNEIGGGGRTDPPVVPLDADVEKKLAEFSELLAGCRGAVGDYLLRRVQPRGRYGWLMSVVGWLQGTEDVWRTSAGTGGRVPPEERTAKLAAAVNDLLADPEGERTMKRPPGDVGNLRTKLSIVINPRATNGNRTGYDRPRAAASPSRGTAIADDQSARRRYGFSPD